MILAAPGLAAPFFADDYLFLDSVRRHPLPAGLFAPDPIGNFLRPISRAVWFGMIAPLTGESAFAFHAANLLLIAAALVLFHRLTRPIVGELGAIVGVAYLAVHYAFDVPARWVSGNQDLLALVGALGALLLVERGRGLLAAAVLLLALGSKEVVAGTALVAFALAWARGLDPRAAWRATWPLFATTAVWAVLWLLARSSGAPGSGLEASPGAAAAAFVHGLQVALAAEWVDLRALVAARDLIAAGLVVAAVFLAAGRDARRDPGLGTAAAPRPRARVLLAAGVWAAVGIAPIVVVANIWSAYYYLFALCGAALALAAWALGRRAWQAALVVAVLALASAFARGQSGFASTPDPWSRQSHVNRFYVDRAMTIVKQLLRELKGIAPRPEQRTMFYFAGLPMFAAFHTADGPLVRWAYRDSSLRSDFVSKFQIDEDHPRPWMMLKFDGKHLVESNERGALFTLGASLAEVGSYTGAEDAFRASTEREPSYAQASRLWLPFLALARGDTTQAIAYMSGDRALLARRANATELAALRQAAALPVSEEKFALAYVQVLRTLVEFPFDPAAHAIAGDFAYSAAPRGAAVVFESFAAIVLAPEDAFAWRRWALVMGVRNRPPETVRAIERYRALAGAAADKDTEIADLDARMRALLPGGAEFQRILRQQGGSP